MENTSLNIESLKIAETPEKKNFSPMSKIKTIEREEDKIFLLGKNKTDSQNLSEKAGFFIFYSLNSSIDFFKDKKSLSKDVYQKSSSEKKMLIEKEKEKDIRFIGRHFPTTNPIGRQATCVYCKKDNSRRTIGYCRICKVALCPLWCFEKYHTEQS